MGQHGACTAGFPGSNPGGSSTTPTAGRTGCAWPSHTRLSARFESSPRYRYSSDGMAKMDKAEDCSSSIPGSSPGAVSKYGFVAQSVERGSEDPGVVRSTRTEATRTIDVALRARRQRSALPCWCHNAASVGSGRHNRIRKHLRRGDSGGETSPGGGPHSPPSVGVDRRERVARGISPGNTLHTRPRSSVEEQATTNCQAKVQLLPGSPVFPARIVGV